MCVIVDANTFSEVFRNASSYPDLLDAIVKGKLRLAYGGRIIDEYKRTRDALLVVLQLERQGKVKKFDRSQVDAEEQKVKTSGLCKSTDTHVIALARVSSARLLCTRDSELMDDFRNTLILQPKGKIYIGTSQHLLLARACYYQNCSLCKLRRR